MLVAPFRAPCSGAIAAACAAFGIRAAKAQKVQVATRYLACYDSLCSADGVLHHLLAAAGTVAAAVAAAAALIVIGPNASLSCRRPTGPRIVWLRKAACLAAELSMSVLVGRLINRKRRHGSWSAFTLAMVSGSSGSAGFGRASMKAWECKAGLGERA